MKAVIATGSNGAVLESERLIPQLLRDRIIVKVVAVALNPTDWKHLSRGLVPEGCVLGCDFAGTVESVGSAVTKSWSIGDRVAGVVHGGNPANAEDGAFAEFVAAKGDLCLRIPDWLSFDNAATLPLGIATVGQGLFQKGLLLSLPERSTRSRGPILIYGASTATGVLGVQFAKLSGYAVYATTSQQNFEYVRNLGAEKVFDYTQPDIGYTIREATQNNLRLVWDTISTAESAQICAEALASDGNGCRYASFLNNKSPRQDVTSVGTMLYTVWGEYFKSGDVEWPASVEDFNWTRDFLLLVDNLLAERKIRPHRASVRELGLHGVIQGLKEMQRGVTSRSKLVYRLADTL